MGGHREDVERGEALPVEILLLEIGASEREIDIVGHIGLSRAGKPRPCGKQPFREGDDGGVIIIVEKCALPRAAVVVNGFRHCRLCLPPVGFCSFAMGLVGGG